MQHGTHEHDRINGKIIKGRGMVLLSLLKGHEYYRRLIPVTSDIHISRADAKLFEGVAGIIGDNKASAIYAAQARLRAQLEGK